jgi:hypothetical protein
MKANSGRLSVKIAVDPDNGADHGSREQPQEWFGEIVHGASIDRVTHDTDNKE